MSVAAPVPESRRVAAWRDAASHARFWGVAAAGLVLDLWSKQWAFQTLRQNARVVLVPHVLEFQTMLNMGALFGIGRGMTELFLLASALALVLVTWMFVQSSPRRWWLHIALGGIVAGALGNMYDRTFVRLLAEPLRDRGGRAVFVQKVGTSGPNVLVAEYPPHPDGLRRTIRAEDAGREVGFVRDFIKIPTKLWGQRDLWPWVFNVADMLLVGGVGILAIHLLLERPQHQPGGQAEPRSPSIGSTDAHAPAGAAERQDSSV